MDQMPVMESATQRMGSLGWAEPGSIRLIAAE